ncbi:MAG: SDR family oxidoreductase [Chloroflexi bacterium]|nr:MAG: SDR family oxidoreductase [Chloroflexota bacterium]
MKVMVTGGAGYIGSVLVRKLVTAGHAVRVVDCGFFGFDHLAPEAELIPESVLDFDPAWLEGIEAIVHLAGLSNDPMAAFSPSLNYIFNAAGVGIVAQAAREAGVHRFVFGSTCSIYGLNDAAEVDETFRVKPAFPYAISKHMGERLMGCLTDADFRPIVLRKGTVVGWSPRMRFDLITNAMVKTALTDGKIVVNNPDLWRPVIDVEDAAEAYIHALQADLSVTGTFNIATRNYTIGEVAAIVQSELREFGIDVDIEVHHRPDVRSYRVDVSRAARELGFVPSIGMIETTRTMIRHLRANPAMDLNDSRYYNVEHFKRLLAKGAFATNGSKFKTGLPHAVPAGV